MTTTTHVFVVTSEHSHPEAYGCLRDAAHEAIDRCGGISSSVSIQVDTQAGEPVVQFRSKGGTVTAMIHELPVK